MKDFTLVRKGYAPDEVNAYIEELENALAEKTDQVKEYQEKETAITKSMVEAQLISAQIRKEAVADAASLRAGAYNEMDQLREQASALHEKLTEFQSEYSRILQEYLVSLRSNDLVNLFARLESFMQTIAKNSDTAAADSFSSTTEAAASESAPDWVKL